MAGPPDLIISIRPQHVANIVRRTKNHEFRNYLLPVSVRRLWIYETSPASAIRYVATISHGKRPGEIRNSDGLKNDEFDRGSMEGRVKYAYEILRLEELEEPFTLGALKANGWLGGAPQKYCFVKPAMAAALATAKLRLLFNTTHSAGVGDGEAREDGLLPPATPRDRLKNGTLAGVRKSKSQFRRVSKQEQTSLSR